MLSPSLARSVEEYAAHFLQALYLERSAALHVAFLDGAGEMVTGLERGDGGGGKGERRSARRGWVWVVCVCVCVRSQTCSWVSLGDASRGATVAATHGRKSVCVCMCLFKCTSP